MTTVLSDFIEGIDEGKDVPTPPDKEMLSDKGDSGMDDEICSADVTMQSDDDDDVIPVKRSTVKQMIFDEEEDEDTSNDKTEKLSDSNLVPKLSAEEVASQIMEEAVDDTSDDDEAFPRLQIVEEDHDEQSVNPGDTLLLNKDLFDAEESDEETVRKRHCDNEEEDDRGDRSNEEDEGFNETELDPALLRKLKKMKGAAKKAKGQKAPKSKKEEDLLQLHSETQRLIRESRVSIPYHQPAPKSLDDFLARASKKQREYKALRGAEDFSKAKIIQEVIGTKTPLTKRGRSKKTRDADKPHRPSLSDDELPVLHSSRPERTPPSSASKKSPRLGDHELSDIHPSGVSPSPLTFPSELFTVDSEDDNDDLPDIYNPGVEPGTSVAAGAEENALDRMERADEQLAALCELARQNPAYEDAQFSSAAEEIRPDPELFDDLEDQERDVTDAHVNTDSLHRECSLPLREDSRIVDSVHVPSSFDSMSEISGCQEMSGAHLQVQEFPSNASFSTGHMENKVDSAVPVKNCEMLASAQSLDDILAVSTETELTEKPGISNTEAASQSEEEVDSEYEIPCGQRIQMDLSDDGKESSHDPSQDSMTEVTEDGRSGLLSQDKAEDEGEKDAGEAGPSKLSRSAISLLSSLDLPDLQPRLSGDPNSFITLEEEEKLSMHPGIAKLVSRFIQHTKPRQRHQPKDFNISIVEKDFSERKDGELKLSNFTFQAEEPEPVVTEDKPGAKLVRLKELLAVQMRVKREEARQRRVERYALENEEGFECEPDLEPEEELDEAEMTDESDTDVEDDEFDEEFGDEELIEEEERQKNPFLDEEADEDDEDYAPHQDEVDGSCEEDSEDGDKSHDADERNPDSDLSDDNGRLFFEPSDDEADDLADEKVKKSNGKAKKSKSFVISDEESVDDEPLKNDSPEPDPSQELSPMHHLLASPTQKTNELHPLRKSPDMYGSEQSQVVVFKSLDTLLATPSQMLDADGYLKAPSSKPSLLRDLPPPDTQDINEMLGLCSGKFADSQSGSQQSSRKQLFRDDDVDNGDSPMDELLGLCSGAFPASQNSQSSSKRKHEDEDDGDKDSLVSFGVSEGEMDSHSDKNDVSDESDKENVNDEGDGEEMDDGSDEESHHLLEAEMERQRKFKGFTVNKKHGKIRREFVEDEAELSGSEYESDENEDLAEEDDIMEEEEGDLDQMKEDELREQVGRVHLKQMLDQDKRELLRYQEMYLPDGDLYSDGKGRMRNFRWKNMDDSSQQDMFGNDSGEEEVPEDVDELSWRTERFQRQQFLKEQQEADSLKEESSRLMKFGQSFLQRRSSITTTRVESRRLRFQRADTTPPKVMRKGSLLLRGKEHLMRLAEISRASTNSSGASASRNFVFQVISPDKQAVDMEANPPPVVKARVAHPPPAKKLKMEPPKLERQSSIFKLLDSKKSLSQ